MRHEGGVGAWSIIGIAVVGAALLVLLGAGASASGAGQWTATGGPWSERGNVELLAVDRATEGVAYAMVEAAGLRTLYRTTDRAQTWALVRAFNEPFASIVASDTVLYLGTTGALPGQPAIWRSADSGATWAPAYTATAVTSVNALALAPDSPDHVYAALTVGAAGAVVATSTGFSWSQVLTTAGTLDEVAVDPVNASRVFAGGGNAEGRALLYRSTDAGVAWSPVLTSTEEQYDGFLTIHPTNPTIVFVKTRAEGCCPPPPANLWRSTDGGDTWHVMATLPLYRAVFARPDSIFALCGGDQTANASATAPTWTSAAAPLPEPMPSCGAVEDRNVPPAGHPLLYLGFSVEGVYTSTDGLETVNTANNGFHNLLVPRAIEVDPQDERTVYVVTDQDGYKSADGGATWLSLVLGMRPLTFAVSPADPSKVLVGVEDTSGNGRSIYRTIDGGDTWEPVYAHPEPGCAELAYSLAFDPTDPSRLYAVSGPWAPGGPIETAVLTSTNAGLSWTRAMTMPGQNPGMSVLRVDPDGLVYLAGRTWEPHVAALFRSDDRGVSWRQTYQGTGSRILDLTFDPLNPDNVYMIEEYTLLRSHDRGETWEAILTSATPLYAVLHDPTMPGRLYLGMAGPAILMSYDGGSSWVELEDWGDAVAAPQVISLAANSDPLQRTLYAGLDGVWRYALDGTSEAISPDEGGSVTAVTSEGVTTTVEVPPGGVAEEVTLLYMPAVTPVDWIDSSGLRFAGQAFTLDAYVGDDHVEGYAFATPITVTMHYSDADIAGLDEGSLRLELWEQGAWIDASETCAPASVYERHLEENSLAVPICHLSYYALAGEGRHVLHLPVAVR